MQYYFDVCTAARNPTYVFSMDYHSGYEEPSALALVVARLKGPDLGRLQSIRDIRPAGPL